MSIDIATLKSRSGVKSAYDFLLMFHSNHGPISYRFLDRRRFPSKRLKDAGVLIQRARVVIYHLHTYILSIDSFRRQLKTFLFAD